MDYHTCKNIFQPISEAFAYCNGRVKISPNGGVLEVLYISKPVFNWGGFELKKNSDIEPNFWSPVDAEIEAEIEAAEAAKKTPNAQARARSYKRVFDYSMCNEGVFDLFITMTCDGAKVDRYNIDKVYWDKLRHFLDNRVQRKGLKYIIVPELHKDGAVHFHGLINSSAVQLKDSGRRIRKRGLSYGKHIYNITDWKVGFTTAVKLSGDHENVAKYITKYITKQTSGGMIGGRYYYHGGKLLQPSYHYLNFLEEPEGKAIDLEEAGLRVVYVTNLSNCRYEEVGLPEYHMDERIGAAGRAVKAPKGGFAV